MRRNIEGAGLIAAIALIVVVAALALAITRTVGSGAENLSLDVLNQRAALAAQSGAQLALNRVFAPQGAGTCANTTFDLSGLPGLNICTTQVTCTSVTVRAQAYYTVASTGVCATGDLQTSRTVRVRAR